MTIDSKIACPVCSTGLSVRLTHGRKSNKPGVMLICPVDGRHIRAFITDLKFVGSILSKLEQKGDINGNPAK